MKKRKLHLARETVHALEDVGGGVLSFSCPSGTCGHSRAFSNCVESCSPSCYGCGSGGGGTVQNPD